MEPATAPGGFSVVCDDSLPGATSAGEAAAAAARSRGVDVGDPVTGDVHALAARALESGSRYLAVAGNDQSFRHLVQAVADAGLTAGEVTVAIIAADPTTDLIKTFGLPAEPERMGLHLAGDNHYDLDLVRVTAADGGGERTVVFAQVSEAGTGAALAAATAGTSSPSRRRRRRFRAYWSGVIRWPRRRVSIRSDRKEWTGLVANVIVGNCIFFHDGLRVSARSYPGDGIIDVLAVGWTRGDAIGLLPKMYRGEHLPHPRITELRAKIGVSVDHAEGEEPLQVHADGELVGTTPARYVVLPAAVRLKL